MNYTYLGVIILRIDVFKQKSSITIAYPASVDQFDRSQGARLLGLPFELINLTIFGSDANCTQDWDGVGAGGLWVAEKGDGSGDGGSAIHGFSYGVDCDGVMMAGFKLGYYLRST